MTPLLSRRFITHSGKLIIAILGFALLLSCAGGWGFDDTDTSVFSPEVMGKTRFQPFFLTDGIYYPYVDEKNIYDEEHANVLDWSRHFKDEVDTVSVRQLVYNEILSNFATLNDASGKGGAGIAWMVKHNDVEAFNYLKFAKDCEQFVGQASTPDEYWDYNYKPVKDSTDKVSLLDEAIRAIAKSKTDFVKLRYGYQIVRMACYTRNYRDCIDYYDKYVEPIKTSSPIKYWALCLKARSLYKLGAKEYSKYCYAIVFDRCNSRRMLAKQGFFWAQQYYTTDKDAEKYTDKASALDYCKDRLEKIPVYALSSMLDIYNHAEFLDSIYSIDPKSEMLDWLLVRGVNQYDRDIATQDGPGYGYVFNYQTTYYSDNEANAQMTNHRNEFVEFVAKCANANNTRRPDLWNLSAAFLYSSNQNYTDASRAFIAKVNNPSDSLITGEKFIVELLINVNALIPAQLTEAKEKELAEDFKRVSKLPATLRLKQVRSNLLLALADKYSKKGDKLKATLCTAASNHPITLTDRPRELPLDAMIAFAERKDKTPFEQLISAAYATDLNTLYNLKGTILLGQHQYKEAVAAFGKSNLKDESRANPFMIHIWDCHDCDFHIADSTRQKGARITLTKFELANRMLDLETKTKTAKGEDLAQTYFLLANATYNLSSFGNSWMLTEYPFFAEMWNRGQSQSDPLQKYYDAFFDCSKAKDLYLKAKAATRNKEFSAQCCFMIAKCDQTESYVLAPGSVDSTSNEIDYFKLLKKDYNNTAFYSQALNECEYFRTYVAKN